MCVGVLCIVVCLTLWLASNCYLIHPRGDTVDRGSVGLFSGWVGLFEYSKIISSLFVVVCCHLLLLFRMYCGVFFSHLGTTALKGTRIPPPLFDSLAPLMGLWTKKAIRPQGILFILPLPQEANHHTFGPEAFVSACLQPTRNITHVSMPATAEKANTVDVRLPPVEGLSPLLMLLPLPPSFAAAIRPALSLSCFSLE